MTMPSAEPISASHVGNSSPMLAPIYDPRGHEPIRAELYGLDALEAHARIIAAKCRVVSTARASGPLLQRMSRNEQILIRTHRHITEIATDKAALTPDAEWLLDNFYIVEEVLRAIRHDLPRSYYRELPKLTEGPLAGYPRVYALALALMAHTDSTLDEAHITRFIQAFQSVVPLTIGELWAVPAILRLGLVENLARLAEQMLRTWREQRRAAAWVAAILGRQRPDDAEPPAPALPSRLPPLSDIFLVYALQLIRIQAPPHTVEQVEALLTRHGVDFGGAVRRETQRQAINQVSVGNCITSLRILGSLDWGEMFERINLIDPLLRQDPAGVYERQDFATRDHCRQLVERLARYSRFTEVEVARRAVDRARRAQTARNGSRSPALDHVGYYLLGPGLEGFKTELHYRPPLHLRLLDAVRRRPSLSYFGTIGTFLVAILVLFGGGVAALAGPVPWWTWPILVLVALIPVSELSVGLTNHLFTLLLPPRILPKLDFRDGISADCPTFVVMPSMLLRPQSAAALLERLEIHYLANTDRQLYYALLTDFADAPAEQQPEDGDYLRDALAGIKALNDRYAAGGEPRFFLFHRRRVWNAMQGCFMGWERKRGKLEEFNRLLRGGRNTSYAVCSTDPGELPHIRYVITLDVDTQLPREAGRRLVGTLAHPLNRACFDAASGRVVEGYGVLQPRISFLLTAANRSYFTRIWAASAGIDPYSSAISDIYQDLFGSGTFTGKGIYDVDAFHEAAGHTFPDNSILSHDLIEGNFARCGLVTDIELFDDFPVRYHVYTRRDHRWIRGDWQLLPWLGHRVPIPAEGGGVAYRPNPLPALERWKIVDNLRRSLVAPTLVFWLILSWTILAVPAGLAAALVLVVVTLPVILQLLGAGLQSARGLTLNPVRELRYNVGPTLGQVSLVLVFLLYQAYYTVDAITITLYRLYITRRRLLEWETAGSTERRLGNSLTHFWLSMGQASWLAVGLAVLVALVRYETLPAAAGFLGLWFLSPLVAFWVSQAPTRKVLPLSDSERRELGQFARKTWAFFETFVGDEDHWLPPDNFQEEPNGRVAHRTSPTNKGLLLLSTLAAHDLGYLGVHTLLGRLEKTFDTLDRLERYRGHFYNWYDTVTLQTLQPAYVSTVDSGNLLGCFIALKQGLLEKLRQPMVGPAVAMGIADTAAVLAEIVFSVRLDGTAAMVKARRDIEVKLEHIRRLLHETPADLPGWNLWSERLELEVGEMPALVERFAASAGAPAAELTLWAERLAALARERRAELTALAPWLPLLADAQASRPLAALPQEPTTASRWQEVYGKLSAVSDLETIATRREALLEGLTSLEKLPACAGEHAAWLGRLREAVQASSASEMMARCYHLVQRSSRLAADMEFGFLYKPDRHLFAIGYHVPEGRLDGPSYDLLASEARLASFLAIARGDAPRRHWFHLGRPLTRTAGRLCLLSWGGTMFEYLMPQLLLPNYTGTIVAESCQAVVERQREYGGQRRVPWGISESAYSAQFASYDYQYQSFGVPGLGLKRGLGLDLVIAPYATAMAVMIEPHDALRNLRRLASEGAAGRYGFYEAIDYTRDRLPPNRRSLVVRAFMAHHQGMSLVALANCLLGEPMPRRFLAEPMVRATDLLLQERLPRAATPVEVSQQEAAQQASPEGVPALLSRRLTTAMTARPHTHLLSSGRFNVMLTNAGAGFSRCYGLDVNRWREDFTRDASGQWCYIRSLNTEKVWSATYQPLCRPADHYEVLFSADKAVFRRRDGKISTSLEVTASPENAAEIRRVTLISHDSHTHVLELTSYAEIVLAPHGADLAHPAFAKLFLETEWVPAHGALLCRRRPRSGSDKPIWAVHVAAADGAATSEMEFETDRARFLGRGRSPAAPAALEPGARFSGSTGPVLDPIFSLRRRVRLAPGASATVVFCTALADSREEALALADHYHDSHAVLRDFDLAWAHSQIELRNLNLTSAEAHLYQRLGAHVIYAGPSLRAPAAILTANRQGQSALWRYGISGDRPIVLVRVSEVEEVPLVRQLLEAHAFWRLKAIEVDLVILSDRPASYFEELYQKLQETVRTSDSHTLVDKPGGVFLLQTPHLAAEDLTLLQAAARVVLLGNRGSLAGQVDHLEHGGELPEPLQVPRRLKEAKEEEEAAAVRLPADLLFPNGLGGFTPDGREYCILPYTSEPAVQLQLPPAPWSNVIANRSGGGLVTESGIGCTWVGNSQQNRLTPWSNDPVTDPPGEVVYLRDETTGVFWTPTPRPLGAAAPTLVRHGQGYTIFEQQSHGLAQELLVFVPASDPVKLVVLKVRNDGQRARRLSATFYAAWVLGTVRDQAAQNVRTELDTETGALLACNAFNGDFGAQVAFANVTLLPRTLTGDRTEFLGRNGSVEAPAALGRVELSGRVGPGLDPCAAIQSKFELAPGEEKEVCFVLGAAPDAAAAHQCLDRYRDLAQVLAAFDEVKTRWEQILTAVQVQTPDPSFNVLVNRWLPYQVLSCRFWGRMAFYQSSGAYGFRDQLQDAMALVYGAPEEARGQLLLSARRQFLEGDVQHWWHPPGGRGVRTRISDDFLWLPYVACHYVRVTGDSGVLDEQVSFLQAPVLKPEQEEDYGLPEVSPETATLYEHCVRALKNGMRYGGHGLPLMGTGDWNDGMNRVGVGGKGESVWDAWFQICCFRAFADIAGFRGDAAWAATCRAEAERLRHAVEEHGWDGGWYRRAYFDDGTPLGSAQNEECQIDSIVQSWAALADVAPPERVHAAMAAADERLVRPEDGLILLFTPPFDHGKVDPGYIKGYVPGIRENGGQYTHASTWVVLAFALLGRGRRAAELFALLNPIHHTTTPEQVDHYKVEPYVLAGDVYGAPPHTGRGGWSWYTGSAAWLYRVAIETMLGFRLEGNRFTLQPCIPAGWKKLEIKFSHRLTPYLITIENPRHVERGILTLKVDGKAPPDLWIGLADDGRCHTVHVVLGS
jgi:cyclic beta-1,2-glucan synthetase